MVKIILKLVITLVSLILIKMKRVLVTGGCGFIGYALTEELIKRGYEVDVIDDLSIGHEAKSVEHLGAKFIRGVS